MCKMVTWDMSQTGGRGTREAGGGGRGGKRNTREAGVDVADAKQNDKIDAVSTSIEMVAV
jgi:hypothetical protein